MSEAKSFLSNYEKTKSEGYYILNLNGFTSYVYYKPSEQKINVIFSSKNLSVEDVRNFLENMGKTINLKSVNSKEDIFLDPFIGYVKNANYEDYIDKEKGVYKVLEHVLPFMYNLSLEAEKLNLVDIINKNLLEQTKAIQKKPIQKPSKGIKNN